MNPEKLGKENVYETDDFKETVFRESFEKLSAQITQIETSM